MLCPGLALGRSGSGSVALSSRARAGSGPVSVLSGWFGDGPFVVVGEAEREKALEVDGWPAASEDAAELVALVDSSVAPPRAANVLALRRPFSEGSVHCVSDWHGDGMVHD